MIYRFGRFEADAGSGELRRQGIRLKLNLQPFQVLLMLLERQGEVVTREELRQKLWPEGSFVDFDHGLNSAINKVREALGDSAANARYVETLPRRGYRFLAPVTREGEGAEAAEAVPEEAGGLAEMLATPDELPQASRRLVLCLYGLLQAMYLSFYVGSLCNLEEVRELLEAFSRHSSWWFALLTATASVMIPVRLYLLTLAGFHSPLLEEKHRRLFAGLLAMDALWAASPFLLLHHMNGGVALAASAALAYAPFAQRSLAMMAGRGASSQA